MVLMLVLVLMSVKDLVLVRVLVSSVRMTMSRGLVPRALHLYVPVSGDQSISQSGVRSDQVGGRAGGGGGVIRGINCHQFPCSRRFSDFTGFPEFR